MSDAHYAAKVVPLQNVVKELCNDVLDFLEISDTEIARIARLIPSEDRPEDDIICPSNPCPYCTAAEGLYDLVNYIKYELLEEP